MNSFLKKTDNCYQPKEIRFLLKRKNWGFSKRNTDANHLFHALSLQKLDGGGMMN